MVDGSFSTLRSAASVPRPTTSYLCIQVDSHLIAKTIQIHTQPHHQNGRPIRLRPVRPSPPPSPPRPFLQWTPPLTSPQGPPPAPQPRAHVQKPLRHLLAHPRGRREPARVRGPAVERAALQEVRPRLPALRLQPRRRQLPQSVEQ